MKSLAVICIALLFCATKSRCQQSFEKNHDPAIRGDHGLRIAFYNVENLFDTSDDPSADDDDYLPDGSNAWTYTKYRKKLNNIAKTILAIGGWEAPALIGLGEIENWQVLFDLSTQTPLAKSKYSIVHENSPDRRGVDVGILYRPDKLKECGKQVLPVVFTKDSTQGRDILLTTFLTRTDDTLHVFVNHWPSRYAGTEITASKRADAAHVLSAAVENLLEKDPQSNIIIMGDFNDSPDDHSLRVVLDAGTFDQPGNSGLVNLMGTTTGQERGTLFHKEVTGQWYMYDQIIVSTALTDGIGWSLKYQQAFIFKAEWLLDPSTGIPARSFKGPVFTGGFSDHLPVYFDIEWSNKNN